MLYEVITIGLGQGRSIIDAVADHGHAKSLLLQLLNHRKLLLGQNLAVLV